MLQPAQAQVDQLTERTVPVDALATKVINKTEQESSVGETANGQGAGMYTELAQLR